MRQKIKSKRGNGAAKKAALTTFTILKHQRGLDKIPGYDVKAAIAVMSLHAKFIANLPRGDSAYWPNRQCHTAEILRAVTPLLLNLKIPENLLHPIDDVAEALRDLSFGISHDIRHYKPTEKFNSYAHDSG